MCKFRISAHGLLIERGRYHRPPKKIPVHERICNYCDTRAIEDEYHFLLECDLYTDIRHILFDKLSDILINSSNACINEQLFIEIISSDDTDVINVIRAFINVMNVIRALKFIFNDFKSPYSILREQSGLPLLYIQRIRVLLIEMYKMYNLLGPRYLHDILCKQANRMFTRNNLLLQPKCNTSTYGFKISSLLWCKSMERA